MFVKFVLIYAFVIFGLVVVIFHRGCPDCHSSFSFLYIFLHIDFGLCCQMPQYFSYFLPVSFIGSAIWSTRKKPPTWNSMLPNWANQCTVSQRHVVFPPIIWCFFNIKGQGSGNDNMYITYCIFLRLLVALSVIFLFSLLF
jgi:hypothetical protein